jgi:hypothetical protein
VGSVRSSAPEFPSEKKKKKKTKTKTKKGRKEQGGREWKKREE